MERNQLMKVAELAHDGMARAVFPVHSNMDGDTIFALSSLSGERKQLRMTEQTVTDLVGLAAQEAIMKAIKNSVINAKSIPDYPAYNTEHHKCAVTFFIPFTVPPLGITVLLAT